MLSVGLVLNLDTGLIDNTGPQAVYWLGKTLADVKAHCRQYGFKVIAVGKPVEWDMTPQSMYPRIKWQSPA